MAEDMWRDEDIVLVARLHGVEFSAIRERSPKG
jgi:hypothetical protein